MATPPSASTFVNLFRKEGISVIEVGDWAHHNRNQKGPWGPVHGVMIHHTVTKGTANTVRIVNDGYAGLPGPLCHGMIAKNGTIHLVGYGRTNHAGLGDPDVLAAIIAEKKPPADNEATVDGNRHFYGFECENLGDGKDPWPKEQIEAIVRAISALCRHHGWTARSALRHLDWQPGKPDPSGPGMNWDDVLARVSVRLGIKPPTTPPPPPVKPRVDLSLLIAAAKNNPNAKGTPVTYPGTVIAETALMNEGLLAKPYVDGHYGSTTITGMSKWQEECGFRGDGIPGSTSLTKLGLKHGFTVIA